MKNVLFLHGFLGSQNDWAPLFEQMSDQSACLALDLPGLNSFEAAAHDIVKRLSLVSTRPWKLVGYSMGGRMALYLALRFSQYFSEAVIISGSPGLRTEEERQARRESDAIWASKIESLGLAGFLEEWYKQPLFDRFRQTPIFKQTLGERLRANPIGLANSLKYMGTGSQPSLWGELSSRQIPLNLVVGEHDKKFVEIARQIQELCPTAKMNVIEGCGHVVHLEAPKQLAEIIPP